MHVLNIQEEINSLLFNDMYINNFIGDRIFQLKQTDTVKPYLISSRGTINSTGTKDKRIDNTVMFTIDVYSTRYDEAVEIQILIDEQISGTHTQNDGSFFYCIVDEFNELFDGVDTFNQSITFRVQLT